MDSRWFIRPRPQRAPSLRSICLPYAGRNAGTYVPWAAHLPPGVELIAVQPCECEIHWIPGGDFFIEQNRALVLEKINAIIDLAGGREAHPLTYEQIRGQMPGSQGARSGSHANRKPVN